MIISPKHKFVFVHIPKCAGTSVRTQLVKCDESHIALGKTGVHPVLGKIDYGHIPLAQLREYFPETYAYLGDFTSYAVVRDPLDRFGSALRQIMWQYEKRPMTLIPPEELRTQTLRMLDRIATEIDAPSHPYIFFARQSDFIFDQGQRRVDHLIPVDLVADFIGFIARQTGTPMETATRSNQNVELRFKRLGGLAFAVNGMLRNALPLDVHARIKTAALRVLAARKNAAEASGVLDLPEVRDFVAQHYAQDEQIYRDVMADAPALRRNLIANDLAEPRKPQGDQT
jgi:hypothetical protein